MFQRACSSLPSARLPCLCFPIVKYCPDNGCGGGGTISHRQVASGGTGSQFFSCAAFSFQNRSDDDRSLVSPLNTQVKCCRRVIVSFLQKYLSARPFGVGTRFASQTCGVLWTTPSRPPHRIMRQLALRSGYVNLYYGRSRYLNPYHGRSRYLHPYQPSRFEKKQANRSKSIVASSHKTKLEQQQKPPLNYPNSFDFQHEVLRHDRFPFGCCRPFRRRQRVLVRH